MSEPSRSDAEACLDRLFEALPGRYEPPTGVQERLEARLLARLTRDPSPWWHAHLPAFFPTSRPRLAWLAAVAFVLVALLAGGLAASPAARAQALRFACYIPGFGIQTCDAQALIAARTVAASADGTTVTVTQLLSGARGATLHLEVNRADGVEALGSALGKTTVRLRDQHGGTYAPSRRFAIGSPLSNYWTGVTYDLEIPFPTLAAATRSVQVVVAGPAPVGTLTLTVPVLPTALAGLPPAAPGGAAVTQRGVTLRVGAVYAGRTRTEVQLIAQAAPSVGTVIGIADAGLNMQAGTERPIRPIVLTDDRGHTYGETPSRAAPRPSGTATPGAYVDDVVFPPLPAGAHPATLTVPFVVVSEPTGEATVAVPVAEAVVGHPIPFRASFPFGPYTIRVTGADISDNGCEEMADAGCRPMLLLNLDLGGWQNGRKLLMPRPTLVDGQPAGLSMMGGSDQESSDGIPHWTEVGAPLPAHHDNDVTITLRGALVAVAGPWQLPLPAAGEAPAASR